MTDISHETADIQAAPPTLVLLTRESIQAAQDVQYAYVDVPGWNGTVRIRSMTGRERDAFEQDIVKSAPGGKQKVNAENIRAKFVARVIVDEEGKRLLSDADVAWLGEKSAESLDLVYERASKMSRLTDKDVAELEGNSDEATSDAG